MLNINSIKAKHISFLLILPLLLPPIMPVAFASSNTANDPHSYANPQAIRVQHLNLSLTVDFTQKQLTGSVELTLKKQQKTHDDLILDSQNLSISAVTFLTPKQQWKPLDYTFGQTNPVFGTPLTVHLPKLAAGESLIIKIDYKTNPAASGLQWLTPAQTRGKKYPYLFTQSQAIHARSWIPLQDTPAVRFTYQADIRTPKHLRALMSADNAPQAKKNGHYHFSMPQPIPSYLMALAVGNLDFKSLGKRSGVYAEPEMLDIAAAEFEDTESMLETAEKLYGPYRWTRYDLLILPPSFPFGGMENPRLSFITPTVIAGDKSLVSLIAHELAHSWSGNLVCNASWQDLWLNEGFTSYVETRIMDVLYGEERVAMENVLSYTALLKNIEQYPANQQLLAANLSDRNPNNVFNSIAYFKGQFFLTFLEKQFGRKNFDAFLHQYFDDFAFQSINTKQFLDYLKQHLIDKYPKTVDWESIQEWVYKPGLPKTFTPPVANAFKKVEAEQKKWLSGKTRANKLDYQNWVTHQWLHFLNHLPATISIPQLQELDDAFKFSNSSNSEIAHAWLLIAIEHRFTPAFPRLENYLVSIGRGRLINPLYEALTKIENGPEYALSIYRKARPGYHPQVVASIDKILSWHNP